MKNMSVFLKIFLLLLHIPFFVKVPILVQLQVPKCLDLWNFSSVLREIQGLVSALQEVQTTHTLEMTQVFSSPKLSQEEQLPRMEDCGMSYT